MGSGRKGGAEIRWDAPSWFIAGPALRFLKVAIKRMEHSRPIVIREPTHGAVGAWWRGRIEGEQGGVGLKAPKALKALKALTSDCEHVGEAMVLLPMLALLDWARRCCKKLSSSLARVRSSSAQGGSRRPTR